MTGPPLGDTANRCGPPLRVEANTIWLLSGAQLGTVSRDEGDWVKFWRPVPSGRATKTSSEAEVEVLGALVGKKPTTASEVVAALARLGGHRDYKNGAPPGPQRLWVGRRRVQDMLIGWNLATATDHL